VIEGPELYRSRTSAKRPLAPPPGALRAGLSPQRRKTVRTAHLNAAHESACAFGPSKLP